MCYVHSCACSFTAIGGEDDTTSTRTFALITCSTSSQMSSSAPTVNSSSLGHSEESEISLSSSTVDTTNGSHVNMQHTVDFTSVTTTCNTTYISPSVITNTVTNTNVSTVSLGNYVALYR